MSVQTLFVGTDGSELLRVQGALFPPADTRVEINDSESGMRTEKIHAVRLMLAGNDVTVRVEVTVPGSGPVVSIA